MNVRLERVVWDLCPVSSGMVWCSVGRGVVLVDLKRWVEYFRLAKFNSESKLKGRQTKERTK